MNQPFIYIHSFPFGLPSHSGHHNAFSRVPCAFWYVLISYMFFSCAVLCLVTQSSLTLCDPVNCSLPGSSVHGDSPGKHAGVGYHALLQGDLPNPGIEPRSPALQQIIYQLSHQGRPRIVDWVAYPFSRGSSQPSNQTRVSRIASTFFTS